MDQVAWTYTSNYYPYLVQKHKLIDHLLLSNKYRVAFESMRQIFCTWQNSIRKRYKKQKKANWTQLNDLIISIEADCLQFDKMAIRSPSNQRLIAMTKKNSEIKQQVYEFYKLLFEGLDDIGVLAPKTRSSFKTPESEFDEKYVNSYKR